MTTQQQSLAVFEELLAVPAPPGREAAMANLIRKKIAGMGFTPETDAAGNIKYTDIGVFLKDRINEYFKREGIETNVKYIDPSYIIRSAPADSYDSIYCARLGAHAVHAAMSGKTAALIGLLHNRFVHLPIKVAVSSRNHVDLEGSLWRDVLENTRQPLSMKNFKFD